MTISQLHLKLTIILLIIFFCSCGDIKPDLTGRYVYEVKDADSAFIEITADSVVIYTYYRKHSETFNAIDIAIAKLNLRNDTLHTIVDSPKDTLYCNKVLDYAKEHDMFKSDISIGCIRGFDVYFTDFTKFDIKLTGGNGKPEILRKIK